MLTFCSFTTSSLGPEKNCCRLKVEYFHTLAWWHIWGLFCHNKTNIFIGWHAGTTGRPEAGPPGLIYYRAVVLWHMQNVIWHHVAEIKKPFPEKKKVFYFTANVAPKPEYIHYCIISAGFPFCHEGCLVGCNLEPHHQMPLETTHWTCHISRGTFVVLWEDI